MKEDFIEPRVGKKMGQITEQFEAMEAEISDTSKIVEELGILLNPIMQRSDRESDCTNPEEDLCDVAMRIKVARRRISAINEVLREFNRSVQL